MFKTWLCANLGVVYFFLVVIVALAAWLILPTEELLAVLTGIFMVSIVAFLSFGPSFGPAFAVILIVGLIVFLPWAIKNNFLEEVLNIQISEGSFRIINTVIYSLAAFCVVPAFFIARYAYINFDDVVSRRWMYRNSEKDVFESTWKYAINRFFSGYVLVFALLFDIAIIVVQKNWLHYVL